MKRHLISALLVFSFCGQSALAAFSHSSTSPSTAACAETLVDDRFSAGMLSLSPASLGLLQGFAIEFSSQRLYSMSELTCYGASAAFGRGKWGFGGSYEAVGTSDIYRESVAAAHLGFALSRRLFVAASAIYNLAEMGDGYGNASCASMAAGLFIDPMDRLSLYAGVANPSEPELVAGTRMRREVRIGMVTRAADRIAIAVELSSRGDEDTRFRVGEVYEIAPCCRISAGVVTAPFMPSFGLRLSWHGADILYAYRYHSELGGTHIWGISFSR